MECPAAPARSRLPISYCGCFHYVALHCSTEKGIRHACIRMIEILYFYILCLAVRLLSYVILTFHSYIDALSHYYIVISVSAFCDSIRNRLAVQHVEDADAWFAKQHRDPSKRLGLRF